MISSPINRGEHRVADSEGEELLDGVTKIPPKIELTSMAEKAIEDVDK